MLERDEHVSCCGMNHLHSFGAGSPSDIERSNFNDDYRDASGTVTEVILADYQCHEDRLAMLKEKGFVFVCSFVNGNSGNRCYIFHHYYDDPDWGPARAECNCDECTAKYRTSLDYSTTNSPEGW